MLAVTTVELKNNKPGEDYRVVREMIACAQINQSN